MDNYIKSVNNVRNDYDYNLSLLRIILTLEVILLHTASTLSDNSVAFDINESQFNILHIIAVLGRFAIPCFFMLTGKLLLNEQREFTYKIVFQKYVRRILLALLLFGITFAMTEQFYIYRTINPQIILNSVIYTIEGRSWSHLWYLYSLLGVYLIMPLVSNLISRPKDYIGLLIILFVIEYAYSIAKSVFSLDIAITLPLDGFPLVYVMIGGLFNIFDFSKYKKYCIMFSLLVFLSVASIIIFAGRNINPIHMEYNGGILTFVYSVSFFVLFVFLKSKSRVNDSKIYRIDRMGFAVYLIHPIFINFTYKFLKITPLDFDNLILAVFAFFVVFVLISFISAFIMQLISPLKKYVL